jgi:hypothetical protein
MDNGSEGSGSFLSTLNFQRIVIIIAILMLIVTMIFIGYALYNQSTASGAWPPEAPKCPDFWTVGTDGTCTNPLKVPNCEYNGIPAGTQGMPTCPTPPPPPPPPPPSPWGAE